MLRRTLYNAKLRSTLQCPPNYRRANKRRIALEARRIQESEWFPAAIEPPAEDAIRLYRGLMKEAKKKMKLTDIEFFRVNLRHEFEITARQTSGRVRGLMYEKGLWMLKNDLGGLM
eukprot:Tbor_TRINITY_DN6640_c0_g1::TRINITY_DN6640_c0_g1_i1::g.3062::m.3062